MHSNPRTLAVSLAKREKMSFRKIRNIMKNVFEKFEEILETGKLEKATEMINKLIRAVLLTTSILVCLSILFPLSNYFFKIETEYFSIVYQIYLFIALGAFYLLIFGVLPIVGISIITKIINRKLKTERLKIDIQYRLLALNGILIFIYIVVTLLYIYKLELNNIIFKE